MIGRNKLRFKDLHMTDDSDEFLEIRKVDPIESKKLKKIIVEAHWEDQGWGNMKAALGLELIRGNDTVYFQNIFGTQRRDEDFPQDYAIFYEDDDIVAQYQEGDHYVLKGRVGSGGEHRLTIKYLTVNVVGEEDEE